MTTNLLRIVPLWMLAVQLAGAQTTYLAILSGGYEVPPNVSTASGSAKVVLNAAQNQITVDTTWSGLAASATGGHIHGPAGVGTNAAVVFNLGISGTTSGSVTQLTFAVTSNQVVQLQSGLFYVNVHSATFPGGEIRGQLLPEAVASIASAVQITWWAATNLHYQVQGADAANTNAWFNLGSQVAGTNGFESYCDPTALNVRRFYRVVTQP